MAIDCNAKAPAGWMRRDIGFGRPTGSRLAAVWRTQVAAVSGGYQKPLTQKEIGQLKQLARYLGPLTESVVRYAIQYWVTFASTAGAEAGTAWPTSPHIGFLLKHHAVAVNLMTRRPDPVIVTPAPKPPPPPVTPKEEPYIPTQEGLDELLACLKGTCGGCRWCRPDVDPSSADPTGAAASVPAAE